MALIFIVHDTVHFTAHYAETGCGRIHDNFHEDLNMKRVTFLSH